MSIILERALAPVLVALVWIVAIFTMASEPGGSIEPLLAGLIGGAALILQACAVGSKGMRQVVGLRAPVAAATALIAFIAGIALLLAFDPANASRTLFTVFGFGVSITGASSLLMRVGLALAIAAIIAQAGLALFDDGEARS